MVTEFVEIETNLSEAIIFKLEYEEYRGDCLSEELNHKGRVNSRCNKQNRIIKNLKEIQGIRETERSLTSFGRQEK